MLSANQITCFLNELFLQSNLSKSGLRTLKLLYLETEQMKLTDFLHAGTYSRGWHGQKWMWLVM